MAEAGIRRISVVAPLRNEGTNVDRFVEDLATQDFEGELEVLVADGNSDDGSPERLEAAARAAGVPVRLIENPAGFVSPGLNACIREAQGELIVRLDCHSRYPADYLRRCAEASEETGAWNVGGRLIAEGSTATERAVACAMDSPFGGIGWSTAAEGSGPVETDTVTFGAFRPEAFEKAGLFDEELVRNQDDEFNLRLRLAGGRIVLDPAITVHYRPRGTLAGVWRQYFEYGLWKVPVMLKHRQVLSLRSMAPLAFLLGAAVLLLASRHRPARRLLAAQWLVYGSGAVGFALMSVRKRGEPLELVPRVIATFPAFHFGHGTGQALGWLRAARQALR